MNYIAPLRGTVSYYCYLPNNQIMVIKKNHKHIVVNEKTFQSLYFELTAEKAALKSDCIEFCVYDDDIPLIEYPWWFLEAMDDGLITIDCSGVHLFLENSGEIPMRSGSIILINFQGDLKYMEKRQFDIYYETIGGCSYGS